MSARTLTGALAALALLAVAGPAWARNPHCAGGIQYVVQGLRDKEKGNMDDYTREMNKAVDQLSQCAAEDSADLEAVGYLGWAYAEVDSAGPAGLWFGKAIAGLEAKGDKKKLEMTVNNRDSYWARAYNDGINKIKDGQSFGDVGDKDKARASYDQAIASLTRAKLLRPGHAQTIRNLATAYALSGDYDRAEAVLRNGITEAAADTAAGSLTEALRTVRSNKASALLDAKKYDEAVAYYTELTKAEPKNSDLWMGLGSALFSRAPTKPEADRKGDFKAAGDAYATAFTLKPGDPNLAFNAALAYQNCGELALAENEWRADLKANPNDPEALSALGSTLADEQKYDEAITTLHQAIAAKPDNKVFYRQLGAAYYKAGNSPKSAELTMVYLAMDKGTAAADAAAAAKAAKAGSAAANTAASLGAPTQVFDWDYDTHKYQTWIYTAKKQAFTFDVGTGMTLVQKSDWSAPVLTGRK